MFKMTMMMFVLAVAAVPTMGQKAVPVKYKPVMTQKLFTELVGDVKVQPVKEKAQQETPFITWGAEAALFEANGGFVTTPDSIYGKMGLNQKLVKSDDPVAQVRRYLAGETPYLRMTYRMLGMASEAIGRDPRTKPHIFLHLSFSLGDHIVSRPNFKTLNDMKKTAAQKFRIACQQGGPHVGLIYDSLKAAGIPREDIEIIWVKDLTGPNGPAEAFRKDKTIDACCVITPDMLGLTGGDVGSGEEGTVKGAHTLNSTAQMSRSIADVYAVRDDWYKKNRSTVEKFVAGYLKACGPVVQMRNDFEKTAKLTPQYKNLLVTCQKAFGKEVIPTLEVDGHGLLLDCAFVGFPGQIAFFEEAGNLNGFENKMIAALDLATTWGYATKRHGFNPSGLDYKTIAELGGIKYEAPKRSKRIDAEAIDVFPGSELDDRIIVSFTIHFQPNQTTFSVDQYGNEFRRAIKAASMFGNAAVVVRGHADPTKTLVTLLKSGIKSGLIKRTGTKEKGYSYFLSGKPLDLKQTNTIAELIKDGKFSGEPNPSDTMDAAMSLSTARANTVKANLIELATKEKSTLDVSQIKHVGAGIMEPVVAKPRNISEAKQNMRVDFCVIKIPAEAIKAEDFNY
jgi:hypothetical protein